MRGAGGGRGSFYTLHTLRSEIPVTVTRQDKCVSNICTWEIIIKIARVNAIAVDSVNIH